MELVGIELGVKGILSVLNFWCENVLTITEASYHKWAEGPVLKVR